MTGIALIFGFLVITVWATILGRRQRLVEFASNRDRGSTVEVYSTTLSSLVGGWMFFGLNAIGFQAGLVGVAIGVGYAIGLVLLLLIADRIKAVTTRHGFDTLDEFIGLHFGRRTQALLALTNFFIFLSVLSAQFMAMTSYLRVIAPQFAGWLPIAAAFAVVVYTSIGGYKGVAVTDILKMGVLIIGVAAFASIVIGETPRDAWRALPAQHWSFTGYGWVFLIGTIFLFPATIVVRSDLWQRVIHAKSPATARRALGLAAPSLLIFYIVLTLIGMASRARLGGSAAPESAGLLLLNHDILALPISETIARALTAVISFGIFAALASTADNNLNIAALGASKLIFARHWKAVQATATEVGGRALESRLLRKARILCFVIGLFAIAVALVMRDIVAVMVNAASIMLLFLPATLGALLYGHHSYTAGFWSIITGLLTYSVVLVAGVPITSAFVPGFVASLLTYAVLPKTERAGSEL